MKKTKKQKKLENAMYYMCAFFVLLVGSLFVLPFTGDWIYVIVFSIALVINIARFVHVCRKY